MIQKYQATFAKPIVDQLIAIFQRDQQAALGIVNATRPAGRPLGPFAAFLKEATPIQNWPALVLVAQLQTPTPRQALLLVGLVGPSPCQLVTVGLVVLVATAVLVAPLH